MFMLAAMIGKLTLALTLIECASGEDGSFEWAGVFETPQSVYTWTAQKVGEEGALDYVDPTMLLAAIPVAAATEANLQSAESEGKHSMGMDCVDVHSGGEIIAMKDRCYKLIFDQSMWQSLYTVRTDGAAGVAFFAQHFPTEFENDAHYLKDLNAVDIEPVAELPKKEEEEKEKPWGEAIGAAIIVNIVTLVGVILAVPAIARMMKASIVQAESLLGGFCAGAILSCAFFLLLFEATHLVGEGWDEEVDILWRWGAVILAGLFIPVLVHSVIDLFPFASHASEFDDKPVTCAEKFRLIFSVNFGDFLHNLCDGIFLGFAFKMCGTSFGWGVLGGTALHEIPQELADYAILTGPRVGLSPLVALVCNFAAGLGVVLGVVIIMSVEVANQDTGLMLAFGGGVYIYVGAVECIPKMYAEGVSKITRLASAFLFILGATIIGLVLLDHEHCIPDGGGHHH